MADPETKPSFRRRAGIESVREGGRRAQSARRGRFSIGAQQPDGNGTHPMEPERLKREFGDRLTFWGGGCDVQRTLPRATP